MKMQDHLDSGVAALLYKLAPAGLGALVMACVDLPANKRELFLRVFVAGSCSLMLGNLVFDFLATLSWFQFLDPLNRRHQVAVDFIVGGCGWTLIGAAAQVMRRLRADPIATARELRS